MLLLLYCSVFDGALGWRYVPKKQNNIIGIIIFGFQCKRKRYLRVRRIRTVHLSQRQAIAAGPRNKLCLFIVAELFFKIEKSELRNRLYCLRNYVKVLNTFTKANNSGNNFFLLSFVFNTLFLFLVV